MDINVGIIDQQVRGLAQKLKIQIEEIRGEPVNDVLARSTAFVVLCTKTMLALSEDEALDALTEGSNDFGVDAMHLSDVSDGEFTVTLFQGKYHHENLDGVRGFPQNGVEKAVQAVRALLDPNAPVDINPRLKARVEEARSLILDGNIPRVRFLLCSNGKSWKVPDVQRIIDRERFGSHAQFEHINHLNLVEVLQASKPVKDTLQFAGKAIVEDFKYTRVFIGKVSVSELARLMDTHGDRLLERNVRRYLGLHGNRVNEAIAQTLKDNEELPNFYFYNNGITLICDHFAYNALQAENFKVNVSGLQIVNGGQTSKTIQATLAEFARSQKPQTDPAVEQQARKKNGRKSKPSTTQPNLDQAYVLVRLYQVPREADKLVQTITWATNSQNPVDFRDLRSNDPRQQRLELSLKELGYDYRRHRGEGISGPKDISISSAAEAILAVWRRQPHQAKFRGGDYLGKLYEEIFRDDLNATQLIIAVLLFRIAENKRKRPPAAAPDFLPYASYFTSMLMGQYVLADLAISLDKLDHRKFEDAHTHIDKHREAYLIKAWGEIQKAIDKLYGNQKVNQLRLAATFRRGDLLQCLAGP